jgi:hypothetical protein
VNFSDRKVLSTQNLRQQASSYDVGSSILVALKVLAMKATGPIAHVASSGTRDQGLTFIGPVGCSIPNLINSGRYTKNEPGGQEEDGYMGVLGLVITCISVRRTMSVP